MHLVDEGRDTGPILLQEAVLVLPGDSPETLHARIKIQEHRPLVQAVTALAWGQVKLGPKNESEEVAYGGLNAPCSAFTTKRVWWILPGAGRAGCRAGIH